MMVFSACVNMHTFYICYYLKAAWLCSSCDLSSPPAFGGYQCITKIQNRFQYFNRLVY